MNHECHIVNISDPVTKTAYFAYEKALLREVSEYPVPQHIAIIMDGNRRFAKEMFLPATEGHKEGRSKLEEVFEWGREIGVRVITVYAFSTENFKRDMAEVSELMNMFAENFIKAADDERTQRYGIKIRAIGNIKLLPQNVKDAIKYAEEKTAHYENYIYNIAVAYGGREEIVDAIKKIASDVKSGKMEIDDITEQKVSEYMYTAEVPDPDLILRTSGEERVSNFLLWQLAYSELYFTDIYWPGFRKIDFLRAVRDYQRRQRRFGK